MKLRFLFLAVTLCACGDPIDERQEVCDNGFDDDGDDALDCADSDCVGLCPELCADGLDNDGDAAADCADDECDGACPEDCADGRDNDGDFLLDCADGDCLGACPEDCTNGTDDDGDQLVDCLDFDCSDPSCAESCIDGRDNDGDALADCDDPDCDGGCAEVCDDGRDNDADGLTDCEDPACDGSCPEDCTDGRDNDGDSVEDCDDSDCAGLCDQDGDGYDDAAGGGSDCDDTDPARNPGADEACNGFDDDCDGLTDDDDPVVDGGGLVPIYADGDGDGWGVAFVRDACAPGANEAADDGDCADADPARNPGAIEVCNARVDDDCDGLRDDDDPSLDPGSAPTWYEDLDGDGYGDASTSVSACQQPDGYVADGSDCHLFDPDVHAEQDWWPDADGDGFGDPAGATILACAQPVGRAGNPDDCDDTDAAARPDAIWYRDADLDGFGDPDVSLESCGPPLAHVPDGADCDDTDRDVNPGAGEVCDGGVDEDCDGLVDGADPDAPPATSWWRDLDADGFGDPASAAVSDCGNPAGYADNADDNCPRVANVDQADADSDGAGAACDCGDDDPLTRPGLLGAWPSAIGAWPADGDATEATGFAADGVASGAPTFVPGVYGDAFQFDDDLDRFVAAFVYAGPFTVSLWVRADALDQPDSTGFLASAEGISEITTFQLGIRNELDYELHTDAAAGNFDLGTVSLEWTHVVAAFDGVDVSTWQDGVFLATEAWSEVDPLEFTAIQFGTNRTSANGFEGAVDDVLVFDRALSDAEVRALYDGTAVCLAL